MTRCLWCQGPRDALVICSEPRAAGSRWCKQHRFRATLRGRADAGLALNAVGLDVWPAAERGDVEAASRMRAPEHEPAGSATAKRQVSPVPAKLKARTSVVCTPQAAQERAEALRPEIEAMLAGGARGLGAIARVLAARGVQAPLGGNWNNTLVSRLLDRLGLAEAGRLRPDDVRAQQAERMRRRAAAAREAAALEQPVQELAQAA